MNPYPDPISSIYLDVRRILDNYESRGQLDPEGCEIEYPNFNDTDDDNILKVADAFEKLGWDSVYQEKGRFLLEKIVL
ncbi:MAG: hypothetical protein Q8Q35_02845 [Nanoarchaeota archaeon]|nr:hypothetical protein [Nanoarchaeota archaeon]